MDEDLKDSKIIIHVLNQIHDFPLDVLEIKDLEARAKAVLDYCTNE